MKLKLLILTVGAALLFPFVASAQGSAEMEAAKQFAKQYGYSESEIENILATQGNGKFGSATGNDIEDVTGTVKTANTPIILTRAEKPVKEEEPDADKKKEIYGHAFFDSKALGIVPSINTAPPSGYILGPGDEITIDVWGSTSAKISSVIGKDGTVFVNSVGPVQIGGMTVSRAESALSKRLSRIYGDIGNGTNIKLTINRLRSITVNVVGDVVVPGAFSLPAFTQIASAVYMAGGLEPTASVRDIRLYRGGKLVGSFDFYALMFHGQYDSSLKLEDNDIISVPSYRSVVFVDGEAKRPMHYEILEGETVADVITYAGGFTDGALTDMVYLERKGKVKGSSQYVPESEFASTPVMHGDLVYFNANKTDPADRAYATGAVRSPGFYPVGADIPTLKSLIEKAGGLSESASKERATLFRRDADMQLTSINIHLPDVLSGKSDIRLQREDSLYVYEAEELRKELEVTVYGAVNKEGIYPFRPGMTVYDLIMEAGGFAEGADRSNIEIARKGRREKGFIKELNLETNPAAGGEEMLADDALFIRFVSNFRDPQVIYIEGEVNYPGAYAIDKSIVRLSDIVERAGMFTVDAYVKGAQLQRVVTEIEKDRTEQAVTLAAQQVNVKEAKDSLARELKDYTTIGIDLEAAVNNPGSDADVVLRTGDVIKVPQLNNTVKISGAVFYPNTVVYNPAYTWKDYINQAGGMEKKAKAKNIYAVYMNGQVARKGSANFKMEPGMELVVVEEKKDSEKLSATELATISSLAISIAYMVTAVVRMFM